MYKVHDKIIIREPLGKAIIIRVDGTKHSTIYTVQIIETPIEMAQDDEGIREICEDDIIDKAKSSR